MLSRLSLRSWLVSAALGHALGLIAAPELHAAPPLSKTTRVDPRLADVKLESDGAGGFIHRGDGFTAYIRGDGSVVFRDHGGTAEINFFGLDLFRRRFHQPERERHDPIWSGVLQRATFPQGQLPIMVNIGARIPGLADGPRKNRHRGAKRAFLLATEEFRFQLASAWYRTNLSGELTDLGAQLAALWRDPKLSLAERKRRLFERWADCEDPATAPQTDLDAMRLDVARIARAKIEAFIRQVAPLGTPQAYTDDELERLNQGRAGKPRFRPYDAPTLPEDISAESEAASYEATPHPKPPPLDITPGTAPRILVPP